MAQKTSVHQHRFPLHMDRAFVGAHFSVFGQCAKFSQLQLSTKENPAVNHLINFRSLMSRAPRAAGYDFIDPL